VLDRANWRIGPPSARALSRPVARYPCLRSRCRARALHPRVHGLVRLQSLSDAWTLCHRTRPRPRPRMSVWRKTPHMCPSTVMTAAARLLCAARFSRGQVQPGPGPARPIPHRGGQGPGRPRDRPSFSQNRPPAQCRRVGAWRRSRRARGGRPPRDLPEALPERSNTHPHHIPTAPHRFGALVGQQEPEPGWLVVSGGLVRYPSDQRRRREEQWAQR
jgi:hypothetical protein